MKDRHTTRRRRPPKRDPAERREDALRPSRFLGYDREALALHLMTCEAFNIAEGQFRRAVLVNPYEPRFKRHLAWCLYRQERYPEAAEWIAQALVQAPDDRESLRIQHRIREAQTRQPHG